MEMSVFFSFLFHNYHLLYCWKENLGLKLLKSVGKIGVSGCSCYLFRFDLFLSVVAGLVDARRPRRRGSPAVEGRPISLLPSCVWKPTQRRRHHLASGSPESSQEDNLQSLRFNRLGQIRHLTFFRLLNGLHCFNLSCHLLTKYFS